jgi:hypothetical protein
MFPSDILISLKKNTEVQFTDGVIFAEKRTPFQLVVLLDHENERDTAVQDVQSIKATSLLCPHETTFFVPQCKSCQSW